MLIYFSPGLDLELYLDMDLDSDPDLEQYPEKWILIQI
jgi:hypothetical protein